MNFEHKKLVSQIPASFAEVYAVIKSFGFSPTLVGGLVRDFLLTGVVGEDWDLELTHSTNAFNKETWKDFGKELTQLGKVSFLPYEIIRLDLKDLQYEFSPPRKEIFETNWFERGHSNFSAEFDFKFPFAESVKRRDFTINAIGIRFNGPKEVELLDPLNGVVHLRDKILHHCSDDFKKDPVRFLRAVRFSQKLNFKFSPELQSLLESMPLENLSASYIWSEMQKSSNPINFLKTLTNYKVKLPVSKDEMKGKWEELSRVLVDPSKHETWMIALAWIGVGCEEWQKIFSVSSETCTRLSRWAESSKSFIKIKPENFQGEFEIIRTHSDFALLFDWYFTTKQLLQKNPSLPLMKMIEEFLPDWIHLYRFEAVKDVKHIDPPLRAKYQLWNLCQRL